MSQLDLFSYSEQYFLVSTTFWMFYIGCTTLFITQFIGVMKLRQVISAKSHVDHLEVLTFPSFFY